MIVTKSILDGSIGSSLKQSFSSKVHFFFFSLDVALCFEWRSQRILVSTTQSTSDILHIIRNRRRLVRVYSAERGTTNERLGEQGDKLQQRYSRLIDKPEDDVRVIGISGKWSFVVRCIVDFDGRRGVSGGFALYVVVTCIVGNFPGDEIW